MRLVILMLLVGCSANPGPTDGGGGGAGGGSGTAAMCTFSGGKTGAVPCAFTSASWTSASNHTLIQVSSGSGAATTVSVQFSIASTPGANSYSGGIADTECTIDVTEGTKHWGTSTVMSVGACTMTLRTVRIVTDTTSMRTYELHGGFSASTEPDDPDGGTVMMTGSF